MRLKRVDIKNFRSIADAVVHFSPTCRILVGMNESGKTNALRALATISPDYKIDQGDMRFEKSTETDGSIKLSYVRFVFELEDFEIADLDSKIHNMFIGADLSLPMFQVRDAQFSLSQYVRQIGQVLYTVNIKQNSKKFNSFAAPAELALLGSWLTPKSDTPDTVQVKDREGNSVNLNSLPFVTGNFVTDEVREHLVPANAKQIHDFISGSSGSRVGNLTQ